MQTIKTDQVRKVFYKDGTERPNWKMFNIDDIYEMAELVVPDNKYELMYSKQVLRSVIYSIMEYEKNEQGRLLVAAKVPGKPCLYGFTKKREYLQNFIERAQKRLKSQAKKINHDVTEAKLLSPNIQLSFFDVVKKKLKIS